MEERKVFWIRIASISVLVLSWIVLIYLRYSRETSLRTPLIITIIISVVSIVAFFGNNLYKKFQNIEEKIPKALGQEEMEELVKKQVEKMWNHLLIDNGIEDIKSKVVNKNIIYAFKINLLYEEKFGKTCWMIINSNYPDIIPSIMKEDTSDYLIEKAMNYKSLSPFDEPDKEETTIENALTGTKAVTKKTTHKKKEEKKEDIV